MRRFVRATQTSQVLTLMAMEEASRQGVSEADIEHLFLAIVLSDQPAGRILRELGIDIVSARQAIRAQHDAQLASLGVQAVLPEDGRIVFHETDGYTLKRRAAELLEASYGGDGSATPVLRVLIVEPSGLIAELLHRLGTSPQEVLTQLERAETVTPSQRDARAARPSEVFIPAPIAQVWQFLADPACIPVWQPNIAEIEESESEACPGGVWQGRAPQARSHGKLESMRRAPRRCQITLIAAVQPRWVTWEFTSPESDRRHCLVTSFALSPTAGGTQVSITTLGRPHLWWWRILGPAQQMMLWLYKTQISSNVSRQFR